jgi:hypothetical protein
MTNVITSNNNNNTIPASNTFAGAIKSLTQKYKTMHLNNTIENNSNNNVITNLNINYKTSYIHTTQVNNNVNSSINDNGFNNTSNNTDNASNNSDSNSSSDENKVTAAISGSVIQPIASNNTTSGINTTFGSNSINGNVKTGSLSNRNSLGTPTNVANKLSNANNLVSSLNANVEWTQVIKLNAGTNRMKSDLNNNSNDFNNNITNSISKDQFNDQSLMHLTQSSINGVNQQSIGNGISMATETHNLASTNPTASSPNAICQPQPNNRLTKSPIMKKISSPVTLPAIDTGRVTPQ